MIFEKNGQSVCFVHIPRNGGRHFISLLKKNSYIQNKKCKEMLRTHFYKDSEYMHITYDELKDVHGELQNSKKLVVFRNPVDRFLSAVNSEWSMKLFFGGYENFHLMDDPIYFKYVMKEKPYSLRTKGKYFIFKGLTNMFNNWFKPQVDFFNEDFYVWKFENGFNDEFVEFLTKDVGLDININVKDIYDRAFYDDKIKDFSLSEELKENVLNFYKKDHEFWKQL